MKKPFYPRISMQAPAVVANEEGVRFNVVALDASNHVLRIQCSTAERNLITPSGCYIRNGRPIELSIWLDLSESQNQNNIIEARCLITFSRRIAKDVCLMGLRFKNIADDDHTRLKRFIDTVMTVNVA